MASILTVEISESKSLNQKPHVETTLVVVVVRNNPLKFSSLDNLTMIQPLNLLKKLLKALDALLKMFESLAAKMVQAEASVMWNLTHPRKLKKPLNITDTKLMAEQSNSILLKTDNVMVAEEDSEVDAAVAVEDLVVTEEAVEEDSVEETDEVDEEDSAEEILVTEEVDEEDSVAEEADAVAIEVESAEEEVDEEEDSVEEVVEVTLPERKPLSHKIAFRINC